MNRTIFSLFACALLLAGCAIGPDYVRPKVDVPATYTSLPGWKLAAPDVAAIPEAWWTIYRDPVLDRLEDELLKSNQTLAQSEANYRAAQALVSGSRAALWPSVSAKLDSQRGSSVTTNVESKVSNRHSLNANAAWEVDLWGKLRRQLESSEASAQASAADLAGMRLSLQAQLAQNYFALRATTSQFDLLQKTVADYERSLKITENRYAAGIAARGDVYQAQAQLKATQAQSSDTALQKTKLIHAIAVLLGQNASTFALPDAPLTAAVPAIPPVLPSRLLERRPDIIAAEMQMRAANAQIGVAEAAWFPDITLSGQIGSFTTQWADLLTLPARSWALGAALAQPIFDAGARSAKTDQTIAQYDAQVANYRQTILNGFQDVEDNLAALLHLKNELDDQEAALEASRHGLAFAQNQYQSGIVSYQNVISAQTTALTNERTVLDLKNRQLAANVLLVKALGGGWSSNDTQKSTTESGPPAAKPVS